ncbi:sugar transferase [Lysinibacillus telephonicus]|uniref:Sugar transferase n=1 Tax=Lysinibacillus telephonicus TaxID=1714840 RepID=A0A431US23_9BACI|nr:sugar transferase [Lysinibacillus telephonicus]RTQ93162.1 sugar transferase [Lysinibacillus telephonicus]
MSNVINQRSRKFTLIFIDLCLIIIAYILAFQLRYDNIQPRNWDAFISLSPWILLIGLFFITMYELYSLDQKSKWDVIRKVIVSSTLMMFLTMAASFLFREFALPRSVILISYVIINILLISWKLLFIIILSGKLGTILVISDSQERQKIAHQIDTQFGKRTIVKYISSNEIVESILYEIQFVDYVMMGSKISSDLKSKIIYDSIKNGKIVYVIPDLYELLLSQAAITSIDDTMVMAVKPFGLSWSQQVVKRLYDTIISFIGLIILSPLFLLIGLIIKIEDPKGSVFYKQTRLGKYNKEFTIYKFRSMVEGAEKLTGPVLAGENDPRITKIGNFIRRTRIDELPQLLNVLKGDMSIVGPRPEREFFTKQFEKDISSYVYRNTVKPGITGYAQIMGKYTTSVDDKLRFDLFYIRNYSFVLDMIIQFRTIIVLFDKTKSEGKVESEKLEPKKDRSLNY